MKHRIALYTLAAAAAATIAGCASTGLDTRDIPLAYAPADTAFAFGNLERAPKAYQDLNTRWMDTLRPGIVQSLARLQEVLQETSESEAGNASGLLKLLQTELEQPGGFANLGLDVNHRTAFYEVHALPVLRLEVADKARLQAFMDKAQASNSGIASAEIQGQRYWYTGANAPAGQDSPNGENRESSNFTPRTVMAIVGNHLVIAMDLQREDTPLIDLLGVQRPAQSLIDTGTIAAINKQYGYLNSGATGFIDTRRLLTRIIGEGQQQSWISKTLTQDGLELDAICHSELRSLADKMPRMVGGATTLDNKQVNIHALIEMPTELAKDLSALPAPVPGLGTVKGPLVVGWGLDVSAAASFLQKQFAAVQASPYQCEHLQFINELAEESADPLAALHAASGWIQGGRLEFSKLNLEMEEFSGVLLLASPNPTGLIGMAQGIVPELAKLGLKNDGVAKSFDNPIDDQPLWLAMGEKTVGAALGDSNKDKLLSLLNAPALPQPPLAHMEFSGSFYVDVLANLTEEGLQETAYSDFEEIYNYVTWPLTASAIKLYKDIDTVQGQWLLTPRGMELVQNMDIQIKP